MKASTGQRAELVAVELVAAARGAVDAHARAQRAFVGDVERLMPLVASWAWTGAADNGAALDRDAIERAVLTFAAALFDPALPSETSSIAALSKASKTWPEAVFAAVPASSDLGRTLLAAAARWHLMSGTPILPRMFAVLARIDQSRVHGLVREGTLKAVPTRHPVTRPGRRVKGDETRILAESALCWLKAHGLAPEASTLETANHADNNSLF